MKTNKGQIDLARINFISNTFKNLVVALQSTHTENTVNTVAKQMLLKAFQ